MTSPDITPDQVLDVAQWVNRYGNPRRFEDLCDAAAGQEDALDGYLDPAEWRLTGDDAKAALAVLLGARVADLLDEVCGDRPDPGTPTASEMRRGLARMVLAEDSIGAQLSDIGDHHCAAAHLNAASRLRVVLTGPPPAPACTSPVDTCQGPCAQQVSA